MTRQNKQILLSGLILLVVIALCESVDIDLWVQDYFYNFELKKWVLDRHDETIKRILYSGIKKVFILLILALLIGLTFFKKASLIQKNKTGLLVVCLSAILVPALIGGLKAVSNTPCPKNIKRYGGDYPYVTFLKAYPQDFIQKKSVKCYPAGHASGGFSLFSTLFLFQKRRSKIISFCAVMLIGWSTGLYKMLIGDHFLSHTLVTMILAWMIVLIIAKYVHRKTGVWPAGESALGGL